MNNVSSPFDLIEDNLQGLLARMPDAPAVGILLSRMIMHIGREMAARFEQRIRPAGLTEAEFRVLTTLYSRPDGVAHPGDLSLQTSQSPANMSRICDALVDRDLITRVLSEHDRRRMVLRITAAGEALVQELLPEMFALVRNAMKDFSETEQRQMTLQLKRLAPNFERSPLADAPEGPV
jgi:MarR family transcriptional regulator, negative regulator of the multidrug operon emrRAB